MSVTIYINPTTCHQNSYPSQFKKELAKWFMQTKLIHEIHSFANKFCFARDSPGTQMNLLFMMFLPEPKFRNTLVCKQIWFCERLNWNPDGSLVCDVSRLQQAAQVNLSQNQVYLQMRVFRLFRAIWSQVEHKVDGNSGTAPT
ncbi:hypothetical protein CSKR_110395 [Clonorchis sinensis]|uniref:Uncharacterized protein n=1 Tax=Clonorchis sinensis TaxID=79923 RepID=A0A3R7EUY8_CLOSI|nr:hypothetical protein CSKR_110395 [Clonorchis sinensis]